MTIADWLKYSRDTGCDVTYTSMADILLISGVWNQNVSDTKRRSKEFFTI